MFFGLYRQYFESNNSFYKPFTPSYKNTSIESETFSSMCLVTICSLNLNRLSIWACASYLILLITRAVMLLYLPCLEFLHHRVIIIIAAEEVTCILIAIIPYVSYGNSLYPASVNVTSKNSPFIYGKLKTRAALSASINGDWQMVRKRQNVKGKKNSLLPLQSERKKERKIRMQFSYLEATRY